MNKILNIYGKAVIFMNKNHRAINSFETKDLYVCRKCNRSLRIHVVQTNNLIIYCNQDLEDNAIGYQPSELPVYCERCDEVMHKCYDNSVLMI